MPSIGRGVLAVVGVIVLSGCSSGGTSSFVETRSCKGLVDTKVVRDLLGSGEIQREGGGKLLFPQFGDQCSVRMKDGDREKAFSFTFGPGTIRSEPTGEEIEAEHADPLGRGLVGFAGDRWAWVQMPPCLEGGPTTQGALTASLIPRADEPVAPARPGNRALLVDTLVRIANAALDKAGCTAGRLPGA
ncbi:hypothetical protein ACFZBU_00565 [Embleya sp. NPDC008237]|uniref:hypothetical protein n=1 Tax=unclassified Embleya TaxID=2699296 RepID=UPI0036ED0401